MSRLVELAASLTEPQASALTRLCLAYVYADGRSVRALIKRGLVARYGSFTDPLLGSGHIDVPTELGRNVYRTLSQGGTK